MKNKIKKIIKLSKDIKVLYVEDNKETRDEVLGIFKHFSKI